MASEDKAKKNLEDVGAGIDRAAKEQADKHGPSEAQQHSANLKKPVKSGKKKSGGDGEIDSDTWKVIGGVVAVVAAVALGITVSKKRGGKKEEAQEEAHGILDAAGKTLQSGGRWIGDKAQAAQDKAGNLADDIGPRVQGAASATKEKAAEILPTGVASNIKERASLAGLNVEKEGLKASEKSDAAVRDVADKIIHSTDKASTKADKKSGGFFGGIGNWFSDRKDDTENLVESAADKVKGNK